MSALLALLPPEVLERILLFCDPEDVARFSQTSKAAYSLVYKADDQYLWRELFLIRPFDDLRKALPPCGVRRAVVEYDWKTGLQRRVEAQTVVLRGNEESGPRLQRVLETLVIAVQTALPAADPDSDEPEAESDNLQWLNSLLPFLKFDSATMSPRERQLYGQLMTYVALSYEPGMKGDAINKRLNDLRRTARCYVYDLRRYREETLWGPFKRDERHQLVPNWDHLENAINVVALKLRELPEVALRLYGKPPPSLSSTQALSAPLSHKREPHDWAGVSGIWRRFVCFMDYRDLFAFNFHHFANANRDPAFFEDDYQEAIRPLELRLEVVETPAHERSPAPSVTHFFQDFPPIHYKGFSRGAHGGDSAVEGSVCLLADGSVRWSFVTKYDGLTQWSAEGVQIGNLCSAAGVAGIWTGAFHELEDPAGPFWMWKVSEPIVEGFR